MRRTLLVDRCLPEPGQLCQQLVAGPTAAFSCSVNVFQVSAGKASWGPSGCLLSRTATAGPVVPTSTQVPPLSPLYLLVRHATLVTSIVLRPLS